MGGAFSEKGQKRGRKRAALWVRWVKRRGGVGWLLYLALRFL